MGSFLTEVKKTKYRKLWLVAAGMMGFEFLWSCFAMLRAGEKNLDNGYQYLFYQLPLMNCLLMPLLLAVLASRIWDIERKGNTFKLLYTLQSRESLIKGKTCLGMVHITVLTFLQTAFILLEGRMFSFRDTLNRKDLLLFSVSTWLVSLAIYLFQQIITFSFENQMVPLCVGLFGSFLGLFSMFFPAALQKFIIWAYYGLLHTVGMDWNKETRVTVFFETSFDKGSFLVISILAAVLYITGKHLLIRKEV